MLPCDNQNNIINLKLEIYCEEFYANVSKIYLLFLDAIHRDSEAKSSSINKLIIETRESDK